ncbi:MAG: ShlB/FhaC/HecB family hemolysin secretion/activation protein [Oleispira sp.]|nr:ShlB/FhaC/HecB family hemolysin secretion/activation protein [Oleispira sp.]
MQPVWSLESSSQIIEIDKIDQQIQVGSYQGWDIYLDNQVETDYSGFGFNKIAPLLIENFHGGIVSKTPSIKGINEFAAYLTKLFPEMDVERRGTLTESQLTKIFNLAYDISLANEKARANIEVASLESIDSNIENASAEIEEFYLSKLNCEVKTQWQRIKDKSQLSVYVSVIEGADLDEEACFNKVDTKTSRAEMLWVNEIVINIPDNENIQRFNDEVKDLLDKQLKEKTNYNPMGIHGFSTEQLITLADDISALYYSTNGGKLSDQQNRLLIQQLTDVYRTRGLTFHRLGEVADTVKTFYRGRGFIMSTVYVPQQDFSNANGIVQLTLQSGVLGKVKINSEDGFDYSDEIINDIFKAYIGQGVTTDISDTYYTLGLLPGLVVKSGLFEVGDNPGETNLIIDVERKWGSVSVSGDNYGTELTGKNRLMTSVVWGNPLGYGDNLSLGFLYAFNPEKTQLGFINYQFPIVAPNTRFSIAYDQNVYSALRDIGGGIPVTVEGKTDNFGLALIQNLLASKDMNLQVQVMANKKSAFVNSKFTLSNNETEEKRTEKADIFGLSMNMDFLINPLRTAVLFNLSGFVGSVHNADEIRVDDDFEKITVSFNTSTLLSVSHYFKSRLSFYAMGSYSDEALPSYEQFSIGGPDKVKAFTSSVFVGDSGLYGHLEWTTDLFDLIYQGRYGANHQLDAGLFIEKSGGRLNGYQSTVPVNAEVSGYGAILRYNWRRNLAIDTSISFVDKQFSEDDYQFADDGDNGKWLVNVRYTF